MTGAQVATIFILTGLFALGGIAAYAGAKIASKREERRFSKEFIYGEWEKRRKMAEIAKEKNNGRI
nr:MAG TPA: hypothetical protein [Caudoviricetes sp.]